MFFLLSLVILFLVYKESNGQDAYCGDEGSMIYSQCSLIPAMNCCWIGGACKDCPSPSLSPVSPAPPPTPQLIVGDYCYCSLLKEPGEGDSRSPSLHPTTDPTRNPTPTPTAKPTKTKKGTSGLGYGDCDCDKDYGLKELRMRIDFQYTDPVYIIFYYDGTGSSMIYNFTGQMYGHELTLNIDMCRNPAAYTRFDTNTEFQIFNTATDAKLCHGKFHTSCSSDIVGTYSFLLTDYTNPELCSKVFCTGWRDGNPNDGNSCNDGMEMCSCPSVPPTRSPSPQSPTSSPSKSPTNRPSQNPTSSPSKSPTGRPSTPFWCGDYPYVCHLHQDVCCLEPGMMAQGMTCKDKMSAGDKCGSCEAMYNYNGKCDEWTSCCMAADDKCFNRDVAKNMGIICINDVPANPPSKDPTKAPVSKDPTNAPVSKDPTKAPVSKDPTKAPVSKDPTNAPLPSGNGIPSKDPTKAPVSKDPTKAPVSKDPTKAPVSKDPTNAIPSDGNDIPSEYPTVAGPTMHTMYSGGYSIYSRSSFIGIIMCIIVVIAY